MFGSRTSYIMAYLIPRNEYCEILKENIYDFKDLNEMEKTSIDSQPIDTRAGELFRFLFF